MRNIDTIVAASSLSGMSLLNSFHKPPNNKKRNKVKKKIAKSSKKANRK